MNVIIYLRQSLDATGDRLAVTRQLEACRKLCEQRGWTVIEVIEDNDVSASKGKREGYGRLLQLVAAGNVDAVVAWAVDRLTRKLTDLEELINVAVTNKVKVVTVSGDLDLSNPMGQLLARIMASVARNEADQKGLRHKAANRQMAQSGKPHAGRRCYGYEKDHTIRPDEAAVVREMARRIILGHSFNEVTKWLVAAGHKTSEGNNWHPGTLVMTLRRKTYAAIIVHEGIEYPGNWQAIFDAETWQRLQLAIRMQQDKTKTTRPKGRKFLLTGNVFCGVCGEPCNGKTKRDHADRPLRRIYTCRACHGVSRNADALEHYVVETLMWHLESPAMAALLEEGQEDDGRLKELLGQRDTQAKRVDEILDDYATGLLTRDQMGKAKLRAEAELKAIDSEIDRINRARLGGGLVPLGQTLRQLWEQCGSDTVRRQILSLSDMGKIILLPGQSKPYYNGTRMRFDPELVRFERLA